MIMDKQSLAFPVMIGLYVAYIGIALWWGRDPRRTMKFRSFWRKMVLNVTKAIRNRIPDRR